jgi:glycosyltransferase involved in cell wall biosynthesis
VPARPETRAAIGHTGRCTFMYAGSIGPFQNIGDSVCAAAAVSDVADLVLVGSGIEEDSARRLAATLGADNVRFLGRRPPADMAALYGAADFQLVTLRDLPVFRGTIPSKLQAALSCGSPVVVSVPGDCAQLVEREGIGLACPPEDWRALAERLRQAAKLPPAERAGMSRRAGATYRTLMSKRIGVDRLEEMLLSAAGMRSEVLV